MPDIDVDFDSARRDEVIDFIYERFGSRARRDGRDRQHDDRTSAPCAPSRVRSAIRSTPSTRSRAICRGSAAHKLREVLDEYPECATTRCAEPRHELLLDLPRSSTPARCTWARTWAASSSRANRSTRWTPLQWAAKGVVVSQYDKDDVEALGLVKMDILGLRMHSAISDTVRWRASGSAKTPCPSPSSCHPTTRRSTR